MASIRLVLLAALLLLGACPEDKKTILGITQQTAESSQSETVSRKIRVALIIKSLTNPFFIELEKGAHKAADENGIELIVKTTAHETSFEQQQQVIDETVLAKVDAIVISPADSIRPIQALKKAEEAGIRIINIDNRLDPAALKNAGAPAIPFISIDNEKAAYLSAKYISAQIKAPASVAIFEGIRSADNAQLRRNGALKAFAENKHIKVVAQESANWKIDEARNLARTVFEDHPNIKAVFCANDMMALGLLEYLRESQHAPVLVAGFDALEEAKAAIKAGKMEASIDQQAAEQGYQGVVAALRAIRKEDMPAMIEIPAKLVTRESLGR